MTDGIKLSEKSDAELKAQYGLSDQEFEKIKEEHLSTMDENGIVYNEEGEQTTNAADLEARIKHYQSTEFKEGQKILDDAIANEAILDPETKTVVLRSDPESDKFGEAIHPDLGTVTPEIDQATIDDFNTAMETYMDDVRKQEKQD